MSGVPSIDWASPRVWVPLALQGVLILAVLTPPAIISATGQEVIVDVEQYDPYDPFRGNYVMLQLAGLTVLDTSLDLAYGEVVYVGLTPDTQGVWHADGVARDPADLTADACLRGVVTGTNWAERPIGPNGEPAPAGVRVEYGVENVFMHRDDAQGIEWDREVQLVMRIGFGCTGAARGILVDGAPWPR